MPRRKFRTGLSGAVPIGFSPVVKKTPAPQPLPPVVSQPQISPPILPPTPSTVKSSPVGSTPVTTPNTTVSVVTSGPSILAPAIKTPSGAVGSTNLLYNVTVTPPPTPSIPTPDPYSYVTDKNPIQTVNVISQPGSPTDVPTVIAGPGTVKVTPTGPSINAGPGMVGSTNLLYQVDVTPAPTPSNPTPEPYSYVTQVNPAQKTLTVAPPELVASSKGTPGPLDVSSVTPVPLNTQIDTILFNSQPIVAPPPLIQSVTPSAPSVSTPPVSTSYTPAPTTSENVGFLSPNVNTIYGTDNFQAPLVEFGDRPEGGISASGLYAINHTSKNNRDPYEKDGPDFDSGLSSWLSKTVRKTVKSLKPIIRKAAIINYSGVVGAASGYVTSGFNPAGAIAGGAAGAVKGVVYATSTRQPSINTKSLYQPAFYGAGAGAVVGATNAALNASTNAQHAASAAKAAQQGYGAALDTAGNAGALSPASSLATSSKIAASLKALASGTNALLKNPLITVPLLTRALAQPGQMSIPDSSQQSSDVTPFNPSTYAGNPSPTGGSMGYGTPAAGGTYPVGTGPDGSSPGSSGSDTGQAPDAGGYNPDAAPVKKSNLTLYASAALIGFFVLRKKRRAA